MDREIASKMPLGDLVTKISCPMLVGIGDFDGLTRLEQAIESYERIRAPKELRVYENEFHPLGGVAAEIFRYGADWIECIFAGDLSEPGARRSILYAAQRRHHRWFGGCSFVLSQFPSNIAAVRSLSR